MRRLILELINRFFDLYSYRQRWTWADWDPRSKEERNR